MRTRRTALITLAAMGIALAAAIGAHAHECDDPDDRETCRESETVPNWRDGNYIPLFDLEDRDDEQQRRDAQRWREECSDGDPQSEEYRSSQLCAWAYGGQSNTPNDGSDPTDPNSFSPNEFHVGFGASHCFLGEFAHQCEHHDAERGEGVHDTHGGAIYVDVCLTENPESKYCDDGMKDTQVGVTIMDHNPCGTVVPIVACTDEYHVIRPFDPEYTQAQMEDSAEYAQRIAEDPVLYLCGYEEYRSGNPVCPAG